MGQAQALVTTTGDIRTPVTQNPHEQSWSTSPDVIDQAGTPTSAPDRPWTLAELQRLTGGRLLPLWTGTTRLSSTGIALPIAATELPLADPATHGMVQLRSGRLPAAANEIAATTGLLKTTGWKIGTTLTDLDTKAAVKIVGTYSTLGMSGSDRNVLGLPHTFDDPAASGPGGQPGTDDLSNMSFLLVRNAPVDWAEVTKLNAAGLAITSRAVIHHPPADSALTADQRMAATNDNATRAVVLLIVVAVVIEVVLLAGPAFAVGVRRRRRDLALLAATGSTPRDIRRSVLAQAGLIGVTSATVGALLGLPLAALAVPVLEHFGAGLGPYDWRWTEVLGALLLGGLAAVIAALGPAVQAARSDVATVLAGRRGRPAQPPRLAAARPGVGRCRHGRGPDQGHPSRRGVLGRRRHHRHRPRRGRGHPLAGRPGRAAGHPAPPAVAAWPLATPPDNGPVRHPRWRRSWLRSSGSPLSPSVSPQTPNRGGVTTSRKRRPESRRSEPPGTDAAATTAVIDTVHSILPGRGIFTAYDLQVHNSAPPSNDPTSQQLVIVAPGCTALAAADLTNTDNSGCSQHTVAALGQFDAFTPQALAAFGVTLTDHERQVLDSGGVLVAAPALLRGDHTVLAAVQFKPDGDTPDKVLSQRTLPAALLPTATPRTEYVAQAVMTPQTARELGLDQSAQQMAIGGPTLTRHQADRLNEKLTLIDTGVHVERGYSSPYLLILALLAGIGALIVLVATVTATALAMSEARPDLATLAAVGAPPRTRRYVASAQAVVIGLLGTLLGVALGFVPGLAVTWPLTAELVLRRPRSGGAAGRRRPGHRHPVEPAASSS